MQGVCIIWYRVFVSCDTGCLYHIIQGVCIIYYWVFVSYTTGCLYNIIRGFVSYTTGCLYHILQRSVSYNTGYLYRASVGLRLHEKDSERGFRLSLIERQKPCWILILYWRQWDHYILCRRSRDHKNGTLANKNPNYLSASWNCVVFESGCYKLQWMKRQHLQLCQICFLIQYFLY